MDPNQDEPTRGGYRPARRELALALGSLALVGAVGVGAIATPSLGAGLPATESATQQAAQQIGSPARRPPATAVARAQGATPARIAEAAATPTPAAAVAAPTGASRPKPAATAAPQPAPTPAPPAATPEFSLYTVQAGDRLWSIARRYDVAVNDILAVNTVANPDSLRIGQVLRIPRPTGH